MSSLPSVPHPPSVNENHFNCPHCGAHSQQTWHQLVAEELREADTPHLLDTAFVDTVRTDRTLKNEDRDRFLEIGDAAIAGRVILEELSQARYLRFRVHNVYLSTCFTCSQTAVWVRRRLVFPSQSYGIAPNVDLPAEVKRDYDEACAIAEASPRGAAALLRLAIQKLCAHLGENDRDLNAAIASLVRKGLDRRVQQALDYVRVIGNHAVHPGTVDLSDDTATARTLFGLVNLICDKMISEPAHVSRLYDSLPEGARLGIEKRDN